jgi:hypothetical protein
LTFDALKNTTVSIQANFVEGLTGFNGSISAFAAAFQAQHTALDDRKQVVASAALHLFVRRMNLPRAVSRALNAAGVRRQPCLFGYATPR